jgi:hypothetical protein
VRCPQRLLPDGKCAGVERFNLDEARRKAQHLRKAVQTGRKCRMLGAWGFPEYGDRTACVWFRCWAVRVLASGSLYKMTAKA